MSEKSLVKTQALEAARNGYTGPLPWERCHCGGLIEITHSEETAGGWILRRLQCDTCGERKPKWMVRSDTAISDTPTVDIESAS